MSCDHGATDCNTIIIRYYVGNTFMVVTSRTNNPSLLHFINIQLRTKEQVKHDLTRIGQVCLCIVEIKWNPSCMQLQPIYTSSCSLVWINRYHTGLQQVKSSIALNQIHLIKLNKLCTTRTVCKQPMQLLYLDGCTISGTVTK